MSLGQDYGNQVLGEVEGVVVALIATVFSTIGEVLGEATETPRPQQKPSSSSSRITPSILAFVSITIVLIGAGFPRLVGLLLESTGISLLFSGTGQPGLLLFLPGAVIIVVSTHL